MKIYIQKLPPTHLIKTLMNRNAIILLGDIFINFFNLFECRRQTIKIYNTKIAPMTQLLYLIQVMEIILELSGQHPLSEESKSQNFLH